jgi:hypothetical protein
MAVTLKMCEKCGRMFSGGYGSAICSRCMAGDEGTFIRVREFVYDNPGSNIGQVSEGTGVPEEVVLDFLRQGRLELKGDGVGYPCDSCGATITFGKYCQSCTERLAGDLRQASKSIKDAQKGNIKGNIEYRVKNDPRGRM